MFKSLRNRFLICLIPLLLAGWVTTHAYLNYGKPDATGPRFNLGVDLAGGSILVFEVEKTIWDAMPEGQRSDVPEKLAANLKRRIDPNNLLEITIRPINTEPPRVEIILPLQIMRRSPTGAKDDKQGQAKIDEIKQLITQVGRLEFRLLADTRKDPDGETDETAIKLCTDYLNEQPFLPEEGKVPEVPPEIRDQYAWVELSAEEIKTYGFNDRTAAGPNLRGTNLFNHAPKENRHFVLTKLPTPETTVTGDDLINVRPGPGGKNGLMYVAHFGLRSGAPERMYELTKAVGHYMAIIFDNRVIAAPVLMSRLRDGGEIQMGNEDKTISRVNNLVQVLQAGALPATLRQQPVSELTMGPSLGEDTIRKGTISVIGSFIAVVIFMCIYYRFAGVVAITALFANLLLTVGFMVSVNAAFTLPGLAGLVLMLAMAVDANVLIYERLREERERGAGWGLALRNGYERALPTIIDTHLTSIFTAIVLYAVGTDQLKGFGISLSVGLIISLFTALFMTRTIFDWAFSRNLISQLKFMKFFEKPNINFMKWRRFWFTTTVILSLLGLAVFIMRGEKGLNIDFTGGTAYSFQFKTPQNIAAVRKAVSDQLPNPTVDALYRETFGAGGETTEFTIRTTEKDMHLVRETVQTTFGDQLLWAEILASPLQTVPNQKLNQRVDLNFRNRAFTTPELEQEIEEWFKGKQVARPREYYQVTGIGEQDKTGAYQAASVQFTLPDEVAVVAQPAELVQHLTKEMHKPVSSRLENFDKQLAGETQERALYAIGLSWLAVSLYLWFRFGNWTFGAAAVLCLIHDLTFALGLLGVGAALYNWGVGGFLLLDNFLLDLPGVAAFLTLIGFSVNDTIVVFDRIREVRGKNPLLTPEMVNESVNQTLSRTILTSFITFLVVIVLYIFGGEGVHLFSYIMVVGVIIGTYSSIFVASPLLLWLGEGKPESRVVASRSSTGTAKVPAR